MQIRFIHDNEISEVAALMWSLSAAYIVNDSPPEVQAFFRDENNEDGLRRFMAAGAVYRVAEIDGAIAGFLAMRENRHVFHMFVAPAHHRKGVAKALWSVARSAAIEAGNPGLFTVNASNYAVPVYEAMGFARTAPMQCKNGIYFNPMQLDERTGS